MMLASAGHPGEPRGGLLGRLGGLLGASEAVLGRLGGFSGGLGGISDTLGPSRRPSWTILGKLEGHLGRLRGHLGAIWSRKKLCDRVFPVAGGIGRSPRG
eukprot:2750089-Pyramimonas_sp.AAC.1